MDIGNNKLTSMGLCTVGTDGANKDYVDSKGVFGINKQFTGVTLQITYTITHNLNSKRVYPVGIRNTNTDVGVLLVGWTNPTVNTMTVTVALAAISVGVVYDVGCLCVP